MASCEYCANPFAGAVSRWVHHKIAIKPIGMGANRRGSGGLVARNTRNQSRAVHTPPVQFSHPGQCQGFGFRRRRLPAKSRRDAFGTCWLTDSSCLLSGQGGKKIVRKEVNVRIADVDFSPWTLHDLSIDAGWNATTGAPDRLD